MQCHCHSIKFLSLWNLTELAGILFVSSPCSELFPSYGQHNIKQRGGRQAVSTLLGSYQVEIGDWNSHLQGIEELINKKEKMSKAVASLDTMWRRIIFIFWSYLRTTA
jgi:hypothetical protein